MDRFSVTARSAYSTTPDVDYFETNCADDPVKMCDFQRTEGRILKTVDAVYQVYTTHPSIHPSIPSGTKFNDLSFAIDRNDP
jgi:hypothetical protein